ncbi:LOW QUALITY PROTEIN: hypothetical protein J0S82_020096, partial [Galemys pyrenaicus]
MVKRIGNDITQLGRGTIQQSENLKGFGSDIISERLKTGLLLMEYTRYRDHQQLFQGQKYNEPVCSSCLESGYYPQWIFALYGQNFHNAAEDCLQAELKVSMSYTPEEIWVLLTGQRYRGMGRSATVGQICRASLSQVSMQKDKDSLNMPSSGPPGLFLSPWPYLVYTRNQGDLGAAGLGKHEVPWPSTVLVASPSTININSSAGTADGAKFPPGCIQRKYHTCIIAPAGARPADFPHCDPRLPLKQCHKHYCITEDSFSNVLQVYLYFRVARKNINEPKHDNFK